MSRFSDPDDGAYVYEPCDKTYVLTKHVVHLAQSITMLPSGNAKDALDTALSPKSGVGVSRKNS